MRKFVISAVAAIHLFAAPTLATEQGRIFKDKAGTVFIYGLQPHQVVHPDHKY